MRSIFDFSNHIINLHYKTNMITSRAMIDLGSQRDKDGYTVYNIKGGGKMPDSSNMPVMGLLAAILCVQLYQVVFLHQFQCRCPPCSCVAPSGSSGVTASTASTAPSRGVTQPPSNRVNVRPSSGPASTP